MGRVLPLLALRAFAEAGRYQSVKRAAEAMGVTSGAVSQQIKQLEARIGMSLIRRTRHGIELLEPAEALHREMLRAFDQIEASLDRMAAARARPLLRVSTEPSFAVSWLVPRLGRFSAAHPGIEVRVEASAALADLHRDGVDIAIRHGLGRYPGLVSTLLMAPALIPVASPDLLARGPRIDTPSDCLLYPLLQDSARADWPLWLEAVDDVADERAVRGQVFDDDYLLLRAAEAGQGLALVRDVHAESEIASGRLVRAIDRPWPAAFAYYAVTRPDSAERQAVRAFIQWAGDEASSGC